jgi:hypothetical protein
VSGDYQSKYRVEVNVSGRQDHILPSGAPTSFVAPLTPFQIALFLLPKTPFSLISMVLEIRPLHEPLFYQLVRQML